MWGLAWWTLRLAHARDEDMGESWGQVLCSVQDRKGNVFFLCCLSLLLRQMSHAEPSPTVGGK